MSKVFTFTGASHSGKTTYMEHLSEVLRTKGYNPIFLKEPIRDLLKGKSIDEIRSDTSAYLELQKQIIDIRYKQLTAAFEDTDKNNIYLEDRAMTDSLFYINNYIDKQKLDKDEATEYVNLILFISSITKGDIWPQYECVLQFEPIDATNNTDEFRPKNIGIMNEYEYFNINLLNSYFDMCVGSDTGERKLFGVDVNGYEYEGVDKFILKRIEGK